jgi:hypothetical protein
LPDFDLLPISFLIGRAGWAFLGAAFFRTAFLPADRAASF